MDFFSQRSQGIEKALEDLKAWLIEKETQLGSKDTLSLEHDTLQESLSKYTVSTHTGDRPLVHCEYTHWGQTLNIP